MTGKSLHCLGHLKGQLTGGGQHQQLGKPIAHIEAAQQGQGKGGGFSGAGLGLTQKIAPGQQRRDTLDLDRGWGFKTDFANYLLDGRRQR